MIAVSSCALPSAAAEKAYPRYAVFPITAQQTNAPTCGRVSGIRRATKKATPTSNRLPIQAIPSACPVSTVNS